jgi:hypothetical protein
MVNSENLDRAATEKLRKPNLGSLKEQDSAPQTA